jgi:glycosyltransferase involved in cell wall biosynthesis
MIRAYLLCWNEIDIAKLIIDHYKTFCDKIVIMDNYSTDGTPELAIKMGCEVRQFGTMFFDDEQNKICKNTCWQNERDSDYTIVCDFDEVLLYDPCDFSWSHRPDIFRTMGWQVMSDEWPSNKITDIKFGFRFDNYSKNIIFNPKEIVDINFNEGAHKCAPVTRSGRIVWSSFEMPLLHYKHIGGVQRTIDRYKILQRRLSKNNRKQGFGVHYSRTERSIKQEWQERMKISRQLI